MLNWYKWDWSEHRLSRILLDYRYGGGGVYALEKKEHLIMASDKNQQFSSECEELSRRTKYKMWKIKLWQLAEYGRCV